MRSYRPLLAVGFVALCVAGPGAVTLAAEAGKPLEVLYVTAAAAMTTRGRRR